MPALKTLTREEVTFFAQQYALAHKSDPFAAAVAYTHITNGVGTYFDREKPWEEKSAYTVEWREELKTNKFGHEIKVLTPLNMTRA